MLSSPAAHWTSASSDDQTRGQTYRRINPSLANRSIQLILVVKSWLRITLRIPETGAMGKGKKNRGRNGVPNKGMEVDGEDGAGWTTEPGMCQ